MWLSVSLSLVVLAIGLILAGDKVAYATDFVEATPRCEPGWLSFGRYCYVTIPEVVNMLDAEVGCLARGGHTSHLLSVHSAEENSFVKNVLMAQIQDDHYWIGLHDRNSECYSSKTCKRQYTDHSPYDYHDFYATEPRDTGYYQRDCIAFHMTLRQWVDDTCGRRLPYICKRVNPCSVSAGKRGCEFSANVLKPTSAGPRDAMIYRVKVRSLLECVGVCNTNDACLSVNYNHVQRQCETLLVTEQPLTDTTDNVVVEQMGNWTHWAYATY